MNTILTATHPPSRETRPPSNGKATLVTIVLPTYNRMPVILETVRSVLAQTHTIWELIVVDDGSTDQTVEILEAIEDQRIQILQLAHIGHIGRLRNTGARHGRGDWIAFLDSDDTWLPEKLERQLEALREQEQDCCYTNFELMDDSGHPLPIKAGEFRALSGRIVKDVLTTRATVTIDSLMVRRRLFEDVGGFSEDPLLKFRDDYEFTLRLTWRADIIALPQVLLRVRQHSGRRTNALSAAEAHLRSSLPYRMFLALQPENALQQIAHRQFIRHLSTACKLNLKTGHWIKAIGQIKTMLFFRPNGRRTPVTNLSVSPNRS